MSDQHEPKRDPQDASRSESRQVPRRSAIWIGRILSGLLAILLGMSGVMKLMGGPEVAEGMAQLGLRDSMLLPLALVELTCVLLYVIPPTSVIGAILLTGYMGGAICTHWRVGDPFYIQAGIAALVWLGLYLREPRLWTLIPWRRSSWEKGPATLAQD